MFCIEGLADIAGRRAARPNPSRPYRTWVGRMPDESRGRKPSSETRREVLLLRALFSPFKVPPLHDWRANRRTRPTTVFCRGVSTVHRSHNESFPSGCSRGQAGASRFSRGARRAGRTRNAHPVTLAVLEKRDAVDENRGSTLSA